MKSRQSFPLTLLLALILAAIAAPLQAATKKPLPFTVPVSGMRLDHDTRNQVSGLALTVEDAGWPTLTMLRHPYGTIGSLCKNGDHPNEPWSIGPLAFGLARLGTFGHLTDQQVNDVTNTMTFRNDGGESLMMTVTRLSPAVLMDARAKELELFGAADSAYAPPNPKNVPMAWDGDHQIMVPIPPAQRGLFAPGRFPPTAGLVKPLRWATCRVDGTVVTGVLGSQPALAFPFIDWHKRFVPVSSLAPEKSSAPPMEGLGQHWLLLWYGSGSPFLSSKLPAVFANGGLFHVLYPLRLATAFQADVPMLLVFEKSPQSIELRQDGDATRLVVTSPDPVGKVAMLPLFGHDLQAAATTEQWLKQFPDEVKARCDDWAKRLGDFPVNETEQTTYDPRADRVSCSETFDYVNVRPGGEKTALVRPMLALGLQQKLPATVTPQPMDLKYATQFGPLLAVAGDRYEWHMDGLGKYVDRTEALGPDNAKSIVLEKELSGEVDKVLAAGHLAPWIFSRQAPWVPSYGTTYGQDPSETLYCLSEFLPLLPAAQQSKVRDYLVSEATAYPPDKTKYLKINQGARREFSASLVMGYGGPPGLGVLTDGYYEPAPSLFRAYGVAKYYQSTDRKPEKEVLDFWRKTMQESLEGRDWATLGWYWGKYATLRSTGDAKDANSRRDYWQYTPRAIQRDAAGLIGYLRLCQLSNTPAEPEAWGQLARLMAFRFALARYGPYLLESNLFRMPGEPDSDPYSCAAMMMSSRDRMSSNPDIRKQLALSGDFSKPQNHFEQVWEVNQYEVTMFSGVSLVTNREEGFMASVINGSGNNQVVFADLTPEVGRILADWGEKNDVARYVDHYAKVQPIWYKTGSDSEHLSDGGIGPDSPAMPTSISPPAPGSPARRPRSWNAISTSHRLPSAIISS